MDYILLSLIPKKNFSVLEYERMKALINKFLVIEFVDTESIFWDEDGDLFFSPPVNKKDRNYWLNAINSHIDNNSWELINGRVF